MAYVGGAVLGVVCAAFAVWLWRVQPEPRNNRLGVNVIGLPSAEFAFGQPLIARGELVTGSAATGSVDLRNQTGRTQRLRIRGKPTEPDVGKTLRVEVKAGTSTIFYGTIDGLSQWVDDPIPIKSGKAEKITVKASIARESDGSLQGLGQEVTVSVEVERRR